MSDDAVIVLASGGLNSAVVAARAAREHSVHLLYVDHGHPAAGQEWPAVQALGRSIQADRMLRVDMPHLRQISVEGVETDASPSPVGAEFGLAGRLLAAVMAAALSAAFHWACQCGARSIVVGTSQVADELEHGVEPGLGTPARRREFLHAFDMVLEEIHTGRRGVRIEAPLIAMSRPDIVRVGLRFDAPFASTWSCERGGDTPCGRCAGCLARAGAFREAGEPDPSAALAG